MSDFLRTLNSSLFKKLMMALTGTFMCTYLIVHVSGNMTLFAGDEGYSFNTYAHFMTHFPPVEVIAYLLYLTIIVHAIYALALTIQNRRARPVRYAVVSRSPASWSSRNMGFLGSILFVFIVIHMADFWYRYKYTEIAFREYRTDLLTGKRQVSEYHPATHKFEYAVTMEGNTEIVRTKDLYIIVAESFKSLWYVIFYLVSVTVVSFHLLHGFQSAFQTMGWRHKKYTPIVKFTGTWLFAVIIPLGFASMPLVFYLKHLLQ
ncbi:succinate dehydrogenase cytochrome b subunit [Mucilaginibacter pallidiroseus]|uniref:Succinate dehydrogenase cytochrome b subunit n=1 Tax=Mucilaginibacter pallidiroseus TaxID=2599295 RepID=A0A563TYJ0_9SPHI|nr:succinate dehydrogenase cytochrome b subunit [Mucilaginibacter pallidiroseus]TWR24416.1 succinate dehydrogenase cytochrome b subunit [Mucilaginibacter pallidiroseus]